MDLNIEPIRICQNDNSSIRARPLKITLADTKKVFNVYERNPIYVGSINFK